ncbi:CrcB family protein [Shouchella sp. 1P09AA]|uniref:fluoride efflux transporter FluC n=1 Tax=unclassified Shouchella TaxID=2893065 RepID=UPI0039A052CC
MLPFFIWFAVTAGGALGGLARFALTYIFPDHQWFGIFIANLTGSFMMGLTVQAFNERINVSQTVKKGITVGFIGGFTTMSTFIADFFSLLTENSLLASLYLLLSVCGGILFAWFGMRIMSKKVMQ